MDAIMDAIFRSPAKAKWKDVPGYEGLYKVSDQGEVKSLRSGCLVAVIRGQYVNLSKGGRMEKLKVSYVVARVFVANPEMRPYVVHVNGDRTDHRAENLVWSEQPDEIVRGRRAGRSRRAVVCYSESGELVGRWGSLTEASEAMGLARQGIMRVCVGKGRRCGGYIWRYE
jgi:hypothetical protein